MGGAIFEGEKGAVDVPGGNAALGEESGEFGGEVEAEKTIASVFVGGDAVG